MPVPEAAVEAEFAAAATRVAQETASLRPRNDERVFHTGRVTAIAPAI